MSNGERIPPMEGEPPCEDYEPAGAGAGTEDDGEPQCAFCGHKRSAHPGPRGAHDTWLEKNHKGPRPQVSRRLQ